MISITVPARVLWDEQSETFIDVLEQTLILEHSLVSLSKWESKWHKAFLSNREKTIEETLDYIRCMTLNKHIDEHVYYGLTDENIETIYAYIEDPMTAVKFLNKGGGGNETVTSELIYYWMIASNIPFECQKWHLNRLLTLIRVCSMQNNPEANKLSKREIMQRNRELNESRKKKLNTKG